MTIYVHSMPVSRAVFEENFVLISKAFATMYGTGLGFMAGPRVASMIVRRVAEDLKIWEGESGAGNTFMNEIRRLSNVLIPVQGRGWQTLPYEEALAQNLLTEDEVSEAENAICFFILTSAMHLRRHVAGILEQAGGLWETSTTLLNVTEYMKSLPTSTGGEITGESLIPAASSHPH